MGIRFRCHHCESELHVKDFQAGKRGRCPECGGRFRVPLADAPHSLAPEIELSQLAPVVSLTDVDLAAEGKAAKTAEASVDAASATAPSGPVAGTDAASPAVSVDSPSSVPPPAPPQSAPPQPALPRALQAAAQGNWYVRPPSGSQYGPAASTTMWQWLNENRVGRDSLVWTEGWPEWVLAESAFDDFFQAPTRPTAADIPPAQPAPAGELRAGEMQVDPIVRSESAAAAVAQAEPLLGDRNRAERKQKRRRNYTLMIAGLAVVMLILIATLIYVLGSQAS